MKKPKVVSKKPRNTAFLLARTKTGAGSHSKSEKTKRRDAKLALKRGQDFSQTAFGAA